MAEPQVKETMGKMSMVADRMSPQAYQTFYNNEFDRWGNYIRTANVKVDQ
jgi:tripartite-type tricarboxylate transporter receptor subunit TctC